jgi:hypothetical protein
MAEILEDSTTSISSDVEELGQVEAPEVEEEAPEKEIEPHEEPALQPDEKEDEKDSEEPPEDLVSHPFERPSLKQVEEAFPGLLKKFPSLRDMYFREAEYSRVFPTIEDAKEASENNEAFNSIRESVFDGNGEKFFSAIKEVDPKSLEKFATNVLPTLFQTHAPAFWRAANPLVEDIARNMFEKGKKENNESMQNAARYLSDYFFGNTEIAEGKKTSIVKIEDDSAIKQERERFDNERGAAFRTSVETDVRSELVKLIEGKDSQTGKAKLDPDSVFSPFIKNTIIDRVIADLGQQLSSDRDHIKFMDSLWSSAKRNGRTDKDKSRILSAYLARAKSLIPSLRSKYVSEALGQRTRSASEAKRKSEEISSRVNGGASGKSSGSRDRSYNPKHIDYSKTSDADIINDDIKYK